MRNERLVRSGLGIAVAATTMLNAMPVMAATVSSDSSGASYSSSTGGENAVLVSGDTVTLKNPTIHKTGASSGEDSDFYGTNAAVLATDGANLTITGGTITTNGSYANGVFSYGSGTTVNISDTVINTSANNSGGIMTTGGGTTNASNLTITTTGGSSAPIRSDRGGGTVNVDGGTYSASGKGSPAIYSTAEITVSNATLSSAVSEAVVVEGGNSVTLNDCTVTGSNTKSNKSTQYKNVMIYQSMSGDASDGTSSFTMSGGSMTSKNGHMFFVTNTTCTIDLSDVDFSYADGDFLYAAADSWGSSGSNGGQVTLDASDQEIDGDMYVDSISSLNLYLEDGSEFTGAITGGGSVYVSVDDSSVWVLTADSEITGLSCDTDGIELNGYTLTVDGETYTQGTASTGSAIANSNSGKSGNSGKGNSTGKGSEQSQSSGRGSGSSRGNSSSQSNSSGQMEKPSGTNDSGTSDTSRNSESMNGSGSRGQKPSEKGQNASR